MNTKRSLAALALFCIFNSLPAFGVLESSPPAQADYERSINAVVRHKQYYKAGRLEVGGGVGVMPYDSTISHYQIGGRGSWHFSDHFGWEILDLQIAFPSVTGFTTDLAAKKGLSNLQTVQLKMLVSSNLLFSPVYGKVRFLGSSVVFFDIYTVVGIGGAKTQTLKFSSPATDQPPVQSTVHDGFDPMLTFGFGFKFFLNDALGLVIDMRDYLTYSETYGKKSLKSNFAVNVGVAFFLPTF